MSSNPTIDLLQRRHARRAIREDALSDAIVDELIEAARLTPSCRNKQPWRYLFLTGAGLAKGRECLIGGNRRWANRAPLLIIGYGKHSDDCVQEDGRSYYPFDLGMSAMNIMLAATHHDLVARPMAGYDPVKVKELFELDDDDEPYVMIAVGKPGEDESYLPDYYKGLADQPRTRKPPQELFKKL